MSETLLASVLHSAPPPWGDYGGILLHGIVRRDSRLQLERTGPFVPPITFPGVNVPIVTDSAREQLIASGLTDIEFKPVQVARAVRLDWLRWDRTAPMPRVLPASGEPEDYLSERAHEPALVDEIGPLWECSGSTWGEGTTSLSSRKPRRYRVTLLPGPSPMPSLFRAKGVGYLLVSKRARECLERLFAEWVHFDAVVDARN